MRPPVGVEGPPPAGGDGAIGYVRLGQPLAGYPRYMAEHETEELRVEQIRRERRERAQARAADERAEERQHERRAERAGYLREKLAERAESEERVEDGS